MDVVINEPKSADVLCGRGKRSFGHPGNHCFRQLVVDHASSYKMAATKKQKTQEVMAVAKTIIARGGRFLVPATSSDGTSCWKDGGLKHGKRKAGHALCDALRGRMSYIQLQKARLRLDDEIRANDQHTNRQINGFPLETTVSSGCSATTTSSAVRLRTNDEVRTKNEQQRMSYVQLRKTQLRTDGEIRTKNKHAQQEAQHTAQTNAVSSETISSRSSATSVPPTPYSTVEPSNDWMTASVDAELADYVRNLFFLSNGA